MLADGVLYIILGVLWANFSKNSTKDENIELLKKMVTIVIPLIFLGADNQFTCFIYIQLSNSPLTTVSWVLQWSGNRCVIYYLLRPADKADFSLLARLSFLANI
jgi:hypothetical protein